MEIGNEIVLATNNAGKIAELQEMLAPFAIKVRTAKEFSQEDPEETEVTFFGNAKLKADFFAKLSGLPALADDSGLCVDALNGRPGVYTARFAKTPADGFAIINQELGENPNRGANFTCCLVLSMPNGEFDKFEGVVTGTIAKEGKGDKGFAYDPYFIPEGYEKTFAEMPEEKAILSHRKRAFEQFVTKYFIEK